ncbi:MAG: WD40 repeat domain-containing protein [Pirellulales bacterium]
MLLRVALTLLTVAVGASSAQADEPAAVSPGKVSYFRDVRPILAERCQGCHQPAKPLGGLVMTSLAEMAKGGESSVAGIVAGKPDESEIIKQITPQGDSGAAMPKDQPALAAVQVELIRRWIAEGAADDTPATERVTIDMAHPPTYVGLPVISSLAWSPDGTMIAVAGYHEVLLHSADGSQILARLVGLSERIQSLAFSPDGKRLAVTGGSPGRFGEVQIWDIEKRSLLTSKSVTYDTIYGASWSNDGTKVAFGCGDNTLRVINAESGQQVLFGGAHSDWVLDTVFSSDDSHLISVSRDRSMKLTEVATQRFVDNITSITPGALKGGLQTVARRPQKDELLIGGADGIPKLYKTYREQARVIGDDFNKIREFGGLPGRINAAEFTADGNRLAVGSSSDGTGQVRVYNTDDAKLISQAEGEPGPIYALSFNPAGTQLAAGGFDGQVRLYEVETGKLLKEFAAAPVTPAVAGN